MLQATRFQTEETFRSAVQARAHSMAEQFSEPTASALTRLAADLAVDQAAALLDLVRVVSDESVALAVRDADDEWQVLLQHLSPEIARRLDIMREHVMGFGGDECRGSVCDAAA